MKIAALDLGSNTFLCLIAEVSEKGLEKTYFDDVEVVRLGEGLSQSKRFSTAALQRAESCLIKFVKIIEKHQPEKILAMATAAARDAENKHDLFLICEKLNIPVEIISGDKEAQITYEGATSQDQSDPASKKLVLDIGGGSTEFIKGQGAKILAGLSASMGCVKWTETFFTDSPPKDNQIQAAQNKIDDVVKASLEKVGLDFQKIIAVAGTPTALATAHFGEFKPELIDGFKISHTLLLDWKNKVSGKTTAQIIEMGIPKGRADVILIGIMILESVLRLAQLKEINVSTRGVRYGVALEVYRRQKQ